MSKTRLLLTDSQCCKFYKDMRTFGYKVTIDQIRKIAADVALGEYSETDPIALILVKQIDEATEDAAALKARRP